MLHVHILGECALVAPTSIDLKTKQRTKGMPATTTSTTVESDKVIEVPCIIISRYHTRPVHSLMRWHNEFPYVFFWPLCSIRIAISFIGHDRQVGVEFMFAFEGKVPEPCRIQLFKDDSQYPQRVQIFDGP
mmetsp:Transcript_36908/g.59172  ORF Transcript_36908/g.59172 Transcript_36908/m.59172 type:complete len:131 (-) Transcript_36908:133-525(-)